eukprot:6492768-Amphidinium_carterae.3
MLSAMDTESAELPLNLRIKLVERWAAQKLHEKAWQPLLDALNPFTHSCWDTKSPALSALDTDPKSKLSTFESIYMKTILQPMLAKGGDSERDIVALANAAIAMLKDLDPVDFDNKEASSWRDAIVVFKCLLALGTEELDTSLQDQSRG